MEQHEPGVGRVMFRMLGFFCVAALAVWFTVRRAAAQTAPQGYSEVVRSGSYISEAAIAIWGQPEREARARAAIRMTQWVRRNPAQVSDADISVLVGLMRNEDEIIRREAAASLGFVGRRAVSAAPALIEALREQSCSPQPAMPADTIRATLKHIGAERVNIPCTNPFGSP